LRQLMAVTKALADENRVRMLAALRRGELCVCQLIALLELAPSTVSKHMSILKNAGLVDSRKQGRWVYYRLADKDTSPEASSALKWAMKQIEGLEQIEHDNARLEEILNTEPEILCRLIEEK